MESFNVIDANTGNQITIIREEIHQLIAASSGEAVITLKNEQQIHVKKLDDSIVESFKGDSI